MLFTIKGPAARFVRMNPTSVNEIRSSVTPLQEQLDAIAEMLAWQIQEQARPDGNMSWLQRCAKEMEVINGAIRALRTIEQDAVNILEQTLSFGADGVEVSPSGLRTLTVDVSQRMINQHLLT